MTTTFGMVSTARSIDYTELALSSFFKHTPFTANDTFILIDNDGSLPAELSSQYPQIKIQKPSAPCGFAANLNSVMEVAAASQSPILFLNNDVVFTPSWFSEVTRAGDRVISSPFSNREISYEKNGFQFVRSLSRDHYDAHIADFEQIVHEHRAKTAPGFVRLFLLPFFCIRIPYQVYSRVGKLDESFGMGGAEDGDYCLRAALHGVPIVLAQQSLILHFSGKSTWDGGETDQEREARCMQYQNRFIQKWGPRLANLVIGYHQEMIDTEDLKQAAGKGDFKYVVQELMRRDGVSL